MMPDTPAESKHFQRLTECVKYSYERGRPYRQLNQMLVDAAMGQYYPRFGTVEPETPINLPWMAHRAIARFLYTRDPRALVNTPNPQWKSFTEDAEIAVNRTIRESHFGNILAKVVDQSLYSVGALSMTADYVGTERGMEMQLVLRNVPMPNLVWDNNTLDIDQSDYLGEKMQMKLVDVREHPLFDEAARLKVQPSEPHTFGGYDADRPNFQRPYGSFRTNLYDYVDVWQVWDRADNRLYVWPVDQPNLKLMGRPWNGPRHGPIRVLHYGTPPGHAYPVSPMQNLHRISRAANILLTKALQQQQAAKGLLLYTSAQKDEAQDAVDSVDLHAVLNEHGALRWTHVGGAAPDTVAMSELARKLFSYAGGNLDQLMGQGSQAPTLGQERMLSEQTTANMKDMGEQVYEFVKAAVTDAYWFNIRDPHTQSRIWKPMGRTGLSVDMPWTPQKRRFIEEMEFDVDVEPYSYRSRTPDGRLADFLGVLQVLERWKPDMAAQGIMLDMEAIVRTIAKYKDLPETYDALILNEDPERLTRLFSRRGKTPTSQSNGNPGHSIRQSISSGAGEAQELMRMFGQQPQQSEVAA